MANDLPAPASTAGWYPDPIGRFDLRFHNGSAWTADVSNGGDRYVDPLGLAPRGPSRPDAAATAAMVLGIVAVSTAWMPFLVVIGVGAGVVALVLGIVALRRARVSGAPRGRAVAGVTMGACALVAGVLGALLTVIVLDVYDAYVDPSPHEVSITECSVNGSRVTATGTLTNLGDEPADFSVIVGFTRRGTDAIRSTSRAELTDVEPGAAVPFEVQRQVDLDEVDCIVTDVFGPLPFGLALD